MLRVVEWRRLKKTLITHGLGLTPIQVNCLNTGGLARPPSVLVGLSVAAGTVLGRAYRLRHPLNAHASHDTILHNPMRPYLGQLPCRIRGAAVHAPLHGLEPNQAVLTRVLHAPRSRGAARAVSVHLRDVPPLPPSISQITKSRSHFGLDSNYEWRLYCSVR